MALHAVLRGVKIVEQGTFITGPCAGMMLADLGADVIKVESPGGDPYRAYQGGLYSPHFQAYNRNKRSIVCDLKQAADRELFERLVGEADVYIQNFRPGTAEKLGAGPARLRELNPRLVYCSISGFGASGPYVESEGDPVAQALSGPDVVVDADRPRSPGLRWRMPSPASTLSPACWALSNRQRAATQEASMLEASVFAVYSRPFRAGRRAEILRCPPCAGLHPEDLGRKADRDSPVLAGKILAGTGRCAGGARTRERSALQGTPGAHCQLRGARRGARQPLPARPAAGVVRAAQRKRRAVRAHQWHRRRG
jgi:hypothetical protein